MTYQFHWHSTYTHTTYYRRNRLIFRRAPVIVENVIKRGFSTRVVRVCPPLKQPSDPGAPIKPKDATDQTPHSSPSSIITDTHSTHEQSHTYTMARLSCLLFLSAAVLVATAFGSPLNNDKPQVTEKYFFFSFESNGRVFFVLFHPPLPQSRTWTTTSWESRNNYRSWSRNATFPWKSPAPPWPCRPETWKTANWAWLWGCPALQSQEVSTRHRLLRPLYDPYPRDRRNAPVLPLASLLLFHHVTVTVMFQANAISWRKSSCRSWCSSCWRLWHWSRSPSVCWAWRPGTLCNCPSSRSSSPSD